MVERVDLRLFYHGESSPFLDWLGGVRDGRTAGIIRARLNRLRLGNFGDCHDVGDGVEELRIHFGPGIEFTTAAKAPRP